jgi:bifunctional non-homologous end joining protein LigD
MNLAYRPMLATLVGEPFDDKDWVFETKWDGFRLITEKRGDKVTLWSRNGINVTKSTRCSCRHFKRSGVRAS